MRAAAQGMGDQAWDSSFQGQSCALKASPAFPKEQGFSWDQVWSVLKRAGSACVARHSLDLRNHL